MPHITFSAVTSPSFTNLLLALLRIAAEGVTSMTRELAPESFEVAVWAVASDFTLKRRVGATPRNSAPCDAGLPLMSWCLGVHADDAFLAGALFPAESLPVSSEVNVRPIFDKPPRGRTNEASSDPVSSAKCLLCPPPPPH